jgi:SNF2 family DNA or RNA helicase
MQLYPHQATGRDWLASHKVGLLADEQGLGKTITAIVAADKIRASRVLVVSPTVVLWNWAAEFAAWSPGRKCQVISTGKQRLDDDADVVVVTHGLLLRPFILDQLIRADWTVVIVDEAHAFKSRDAKRTRALYGSVIGAARACWILTGTPCPNHAGELWTHLDALAPGRIELDGGGRQLREHEFVDRFCHWRQTPYGRKVTGNRRDRLPELKKRLDGFILRRLKKNELKDLPPIRFETVHLRPLKLPAALAALSGTLSGRVEEALAGAEDAADVFERLKDSEDFTRFRRLCGMAKAEPVAELLEQELESGSLEKVVIFAWHGAVIEKLAEKLERFGCMTITGATPALERRQIVERFQMPTVVSHRRVLVANIIAGGVGITLTAASDVVFAEQSWTPGDNAQAADRCHRIGQTEKVRVRFVSLAGTIDEAVTATLRTKARMIREVLGE